MARSKTPPRPLREALRGRMGRTPAGIAEDAEDHRDGGPQIHGSCFLPLLWPVSRISLQKKFGSHHWTYPNPWPGRKRHRALCGRLSGAEWGGPPQRSQRTQRIIGMEDRRYMEAVFCHCFGQSVGILPKKKFGSHHWTYPHPWPGRKRHRALCGRLSGAGWGKRPPCRTASNGRLHCDAKSWPNQERPSACRPKPTRAPPCRSRTTSHPRPGPYTHPNGTPGSHT